MYKKYNFKKIKYKNILYLLILVNRIFKYFFFKYSRDAVLVKQQYNDTTFKKIFNEKIWLQKKKLSDYLFRQQGSGIFFLENNIYRSKINEYYKFRFKSINNLISKFCDTKEIVELGCGAGDIVFNLILSKRYKKVYGYDISKYGINSAKNISKHFNCQKNCKFDILDLTKNIKKINFKNKTVYTHYCLEQLKNKTEKIINNLIKTNLKKCIHIEPSLELLNKYKLSHICTKLYIKQHGYLDNLIDILEKLEKQKKIRIIHKKLIFYSPNLSNIAHVVVWEKI